MQTLYLCGKDLIKMRSDEMNLKQYVRNNELLVISYL